MSVKFALKRGAAAQKMLDEADKETERRKAAASRGRRFFIGKGKEDDTRITFLDGALLADTRLDAPTLWEHTYKVPGRKAYEHYMCLKDDESCPMCEGEGDSARPALVFLFTVVDHSGYSTKQGKKVEHEKKLFACKRETYRRLQKLAQKHGGLVGVTVDASRVGGEKSAAVGDNFDFVEKHEVGKAAVQKQLAKQWALKDVRPVDYEADGVLTRMTAAELRKNGFGRGGAPTLGSGDRDAMRGGDPDVDDTDV